MRIVAISGILDYPDRYAMWNHWKRAFTRVYPNATFVAEHQFYHFYNVRFMRAFAAEIVGRHDTGESLLLVGHSMGGLIALRVAAQCKKSLVCGVVTVFTPHRLYGGLFRLANRAPRLRKDIPVVSIEASGDTTVWHGARYHKQYPHEIIHSNHWRDLVRYPDYADEIARIAHKYIKEPGT